MKNKIALLALVLFALPVASWGLTSGCVSNTNTGDAGTVCFTVSGNVITVTSLTVNGVNVTGTSNLKFDEIGISGSTFVSGSTSGFDILGSGNEDGFGGFTDTAKFTPASGAPNLSSGVTFTVVNASAITGIVFHFGGVIIGQTNCSIWVGGPTITSNTSGGNAICGGTTVPEPSSMALLFGGFAGLAGLARRRFRK